MVNKNGYFTSGSSNVLILTCNSTGIKTIEYSDLNGPRTVKVYDENLNEISILRLNCIRFVDSEKYIYVHSFNNINVYDTKNLSNLVSTHVLQAIKPNKISNIQFKINDEFIY